MSSPKILTWDSDWFAAAHYATGESAIPNAAVVLPF